MAEIKVQYKASLEEDLRKIKESGDKYLTIEKPRIRRTRMHSVPIAIPPGVPVAWTTLTLPNGKVISTYSIGDGKPVSQEGFSYGPGHTTCELVSEPNDQPINVKSGESDIGTDSGRANQAPDRGKEYDFDLGGGFHSVSIE